MNPDLEQIRQALEQAFDNAKSFVAYTGKLGAIDFTVNFSIHMRERFGGLPLSDDEKQKIREEVINSKIWEPGAYEITENGVKYMGLEDDTMADGIFLIKREGRWYVEKWENHQRVTYKIITEAEAQALKNNETTF